MRLAAPLKAIGSRFALPLLIIASAVLIVLNKADSGLFERIRTPFVDAVEPVLEFFARPAATLDAVTEHVESAVALYAENQRLKEENQRLLHWQHAARTLHAENQRLKALLNFAPDPPASFVSARVIAHSGGSFVRSVLINAGRVDGIARGQAALAAEGLAGRIAEVGERTARVLLLTDLNSRVPVLLDASRERAVLAGDNSERPRLLYLPARAEVKIGERVVSSGHGGVFPPNLPVGVVAAIEDGVVRVEPYVELSRLDYLRIVDYGLSGVLPQPVLPKARERRSKSAEPQPPVEAMP
jgi:rod shape-determining protein MreC